MKHTIEEIVYCYPTKYPQGFINEEIDELLEFYNIKREVFNEKHGINTCMLSKNKEIINYHTDVYQTISNIINNKETHPLIWD